MIDINEVLKFISEYRHENTKTWTELAADIGGISDTTVRAVMMHERAPSPSTLEKMTDFYFSAQGLVNPRHIYEDVADRASKALKEEKQEQAESEPEGIKADTRSENSMTYDFCLIETRNVINQIASAITVVEQYMLDQCEKDTAIDGMADAMGSIAVISRELNRLRIKEEN